MIDIARAGYAARLPLGDERPPAPEGLFDGSTRILDEYGWAPGQPASVRVSARNETSLSWTEMPLTGRNVPAAHLIAHRLELGSEGMTDRVRVRSLTAAPAHVALRLLVGSDMADQFSLRLDSARFAPHERRLDIRAEADGATWTLEAGRPGMPAWHDACRVEADPAPDRISVSREGERASAVLAWDLELPGLAESEIVVRTHRPAHARPPRPVPGTLDLAAPLTLEPLLIAAPGSGERVPAAGSPWFLTLFGRDALWSAFLARTVHPELLGAVVRALAVHQGTRYDAARQEQPGKIVHEVRDGEFAALDLVPYARYYGGVDTTCLWLMMLARCDAETQRGLAHEARAAITWIRTDGGLDATGFVRYDSDPDGLVHQGWKDSHDALLDAEGGPVSRGIALVEVQGYAYAALRGAERMARGVWDDEALADDCADAADALRDRFRAVFVEGTDFPPLAVHDGERRVASVTSDPGHLLLTGILDPADARRIADRLLEPDLFTGYGLRTLAEGEHAYSPAAYHRGSVWPHDTAIAMEGMAASGLDEHADALARGLVALFDGIGGAAPEYVLGLDAASMPVVIPPQSAMPQAWSRAARIAALARLGRGPSIPTQEVR